MPICHIKNAQSLRWSLLLICLIPFFHVFPLVNIPFYEEELPENKLYKPILGTFYPGSYELDTLLSAQFITLTSKAANVKDVQIDSYFILILSPTLPARLLNYMGPSLEQARQSLTNLKEGDVILIGVNVLDKEGVKWRNTNYAKYKIK